MTKITVKRATLRRRIERTLAAKGHQIKAIGAQWHVIDIESKIVVATYPTLEAMAQALGLLEPWEQIEKEE